MDRALALAARGLGRTFPNPPVGAVFVRDGRVVGEGFHARAGGPHAEIEALRRAGRRAEGADLYVTLEPCAHSGRTPPCVAALLPLRLRRVVVAVVDPNPKVRGRSVRALRRAGVRVTTGVRAAEGEALIRGYRRWILTRRPWVILKLAVSLDGRIAAAPGRFGWITGAAARRRAHAMRAAADAILVGARTIRADDPRLTCRTRRGADPVRVVLCGPRLDLPVRARVFARDGVPVWVVAPRGASRKRIAALERAGACVLLLPGRRGRVPFGRVVAALGARGVTSLLVEGGGEVAAAALGARAVDEVALFQAPIVLGAGGVPAVGALAIAGPNRAVRLGAVRTEAVGRDLLVTGTVRRGT
jgi:diaminohydroxyphosphoribosylaminopyrimidine deaminase/5-amino-6-(5-phosphoribosylamino)uracil reductase